MKSKILFLIWRNGPRADARGGIAGLKDIPRCQGCRDVQISDGRGEIRLNELRARSPQNPRSGLSSAPVI
jgi:hypothetical protein